MPGEGLGFVAMIVRIVSGRVTPGREGQFNRLLRDQVPILKAQPGLVYVKVARQILPDGERIILIEEWADPRRVHAWAGPDLSRPRLLPGATELLEEVDVQHYEALDIDPETLL